MPNENKKTITFDRQELSNFKRSYTVAIRNKKDQFTFQGNQFLVSYAKYLIECLEIKLK